MTRHLVAPTLKVVDTVGVEFSEIVILDEVLKTPISDHILTFPGKFNFAKLPKTPFFYMLESRCVPK